MMFAYLLNGQMEQFLEVYRGIVLNCTSYYGAKENAYHMLFLGMCISLDGLYKVTSNMEHGHGRSDITLEARAKKHPHIIIEFKQGEDIDGLKQEALRQILDKKHYEGLEGEVWCIGLAHNKKDCELVYRKIIF